ncbi:MAG: endonuclease III [Oscillospiraceae bacterium]|nr:endonuclease III [Oscillospiraceae bacterium]
MDDILRHRAETVIKVLEEVYPDARCSLEYKEPYQLLIATRLSAQCTDARVNMVTPALFERFPSIEAFAEAEIGDIEPYIRSCGLYHTKAESIRDMCRALMDMGGTLPDTVEELTRLPGVGRKTANLLVGDVYGKPAIVCDTHCIRICGRLGLTTSKDPLKTERELREILPPDKSSDLCHRLVMFGRDTCTARKPDCEHCPLRTRLDGYVCRT